MQHMEMLPESRASSTLNFKKNIVFQQSQTENQEISKTRKYLR